jgi:hypothetical protein
LRAWQAILLLTAAIGQTDAAVASDVDRTDLRGAIERGEALPLYSLQERIEQRMDGALVDVSVYSVGELYYRVLVRQRNGRMVSAVVDARTGDFVPVSSPIARTVQENARREGAGNRIELRPNQGRGGASAKGGGPGQGNAPGGGAGASSGRQDGGASGGAGGGNGGGRGSEGSSGRGGGNSGTDDRSPAGSSGEDGNAGDANGSGGSSGNGGGGNGNDGGSSGGNGGSNGNGGDNGNGGGSSSGNGNGGGNGNEGNGRGGS